MGEQQQLPGAASLLLPSARAELSPFLRCLGICSPYPQHSNPALEVRAPGSAFLEISFSCPSFAFIRLPPLRSAACQGRVTKGWVEKNDFRPI